MNIFTIIERFPERFCFKLDEIEVINLKSQNVISSLTKIKKFFFQELIDMWFQNGTT